MENPKRRREKMRLLLIEGKEHYPMNQHNGLLPYTDKSDSKLIKLNLRMSKSAFKRAVGHLLKTNQIIMTEGKIRLKR